MSVLEEIRNDAAGAALLADWLGSGLAPVPQMRADHRAYECTNGDDGGPCPKNKEPNWWDRVKSAIADTIKRELELKQRLSLKAAGEDQLQMCSICGCCLRLKVWTPIEHIKRHTNLVKLQEAPRFCWIRKEMGQNL